MIASADNNYTIFVSYCFHIETLLMPLLLVSPDFEATALERTVSVAGFHDSFQLLSVVYPLPFLHLSSDLHPTTARGLTARRVLGYSRRMKPQTKDVHIYFPVPVLAALKKLAKENRRSVSAEIVLAVENKVREWQSQGQANGTRRK